jgi:AcrR family transcriptional regulator
MCQPNAEVYVVSSEAGGYGDPDTRRRIVEATREVVAERGSALTLRDVAERAGVSRQAVYLHFGDRTKLLVALVQHMDETLDLGPSLEHVREADAGREVIDRTMQLHSSFSAAIDPVAIVLEAEQYHDGSLGTAWRDRLRFRRQAHRTIVERLDELGALAPVWPPEVAADLFYALTLPAVWREVTRELGWSQSAYIERFSRFLARALLDGEAQPHRRGGTGPGQA